MGPDCGTAVVGGVGLGFANVVRPGPVGLVAASGTGAQQLMCLLDTPGGRHQPLPRRRRARPVRRGRRAARPGGARAARRRPGDRADRAWCPSRRTPAVAAEITAYAESLATPVLLALLGQGQHDLTTRRRSGRVESLGGLAAWPSRGRWDDAAGAGRRRRRCAGCSRAARCATRRWSSPPRRSGEVRSNIPLRPEWAVGDDLRSAGHLMVDFGDDALTLGRAHPMIDPALRLERLAAEARRPDLRRCSCSTSCSATAPTPTRRPSWRRRSRRPRRRGREDGRELAVVVVAVRHRTTTRRTRAGRPRRCTRPARSVFAVQRGRRPARRRPSWQTGERPRSRRSACLGQRASRRLVGRRAPQLFADALAAPGRRRSTQVDWRPPLATPAPRRAGPGAGRPAARRGQRRRRVDADARRAAPSWSTSGRRARRSASSRGEFLHAGPPIGWDRASGPLRGALIGAMLFEGSPTPPEEAERAARAAATASRLEPVPPPPHRRADGGRGQPVDVDVRAARPGARRHRVVLAQRGPGQGAAVRRLRARGHRAAALDVRRARPAAADGRAVARRAGRSTSRRSPRRCCRWATRATTATAPAR